MGDTLSRVTISRAGDVFNRYFLSKSNQICADYIQRQSIVVYISIMMLNNNALQENFNSDEVSQLWQLADKHLRKSHISLKWLSPVVRAWLRDGHLQSDAVSTWDILITMMHYHRLGQSMTHRLLTDNNLLDDSLLPVSQFGVEGHTRSSHPSISSSFSYLRHHVNGLMYLFYLCISLTGIYLADHGLPVTYGHIFLLSVCTW